MRTYEPPSADTWTGGNWFNDTGENESAYVDPRMPVVSRPAPHYDAPQTREAPGKTPRKTRRGVGFFGVTLTILVSLILGVVGTLLALAFLAPQPPALQISSPTSQDLSVNVDDAFLTQQVTASLAKGSLPMKVSNVIVHVAANSTLDVGGDLPDAPKLAGQPARRFSATLSLSVQNGKLAAQVASITFGALVFPAAVVNAFKTSLAGAFASAGDGIVGQGAWGPAALSTVAGTLTIFLAAR